MNSLRILIKEFKENDQICLDFNSKDKNGDTCLSLVTMRCYLSETETEDVETFMNKRAEMTKLILTHSDPYNLVNTGMNNPLHWCVYYGDINLGKKLFKINPGLLIQTNEIGENPFELVLNKNVKLHAYKNSFTLVKQLCLAFGELLNQFIESEQKNENLKQPFYKFLKKIITSVKKSKQTKSESLDVELGKVKIHIFSRKNSFMKKSQMVFLHKFLALNIILGNLGIAGMLMKNFGVSPFYQCIKGKNCFQFANQKHNIDAIEMILALDYSYVGRSRKFDLGKKIAKTSQKKSNTSLHFAALSNQSDNFDFVEKMGSYAISVSNNRNWLPVECSRNIKFIEKQKNTEKKQLREEMEKNSNNLLDPNFRDSKHVEKYKHKYLYKIVCRDQAESAMNTLIFQQLDRVNELQNKDHKGLKEFQDFDEQIFNEHMNTPKSHTEFAQNKEFIKGGDDLDFNDQLIDSKVSLLGEERKDTHRTEEFNGSLLKVKWIELSDFKVRGRNYYKHCFLLGIQENSLDQLADFLNLKVYNRKKETAEFFMSGKANEYENFRMSHLQKMLLFLVNKEFDLEDLTRKGIIENHGFLHEVPLARQVRYSWEHGQFKLLQNNISFNRTDVSLLKPLGRINYYLGSDVAFYLGFTNTYSSWLLLMSFFGIITTVMSVVEGKGDNFLLPILALIISLIVTLAEQFWCRRQNELSFLWDAHALSENEIQRKKHRGRFVINSITRKIRKKSKWSTIQRRCVTEIPVGLLGLLFIISNFILFFKLNKNNNLLKDNGKITEMEYTLWAMAYGAGNGVSISVLYVIYKQVVNSVMEWENHRFESTTVNSRIPKLFLFYFSMNYINLFFYAFYLQDFKMLQSNFISLFLTRSVSNISISYLLPLILFWFKRRYIFKNYLKSRALRKEFFLKDSYSEDTNYSSLSKALKEELLDHEKNLYLWEQMEESMARPAPPDMTVIWMNQLLQFGFIAFFGIVFPIVPLLGFFFNLLDSYLMTFVFTKICWRRQVFPLKDAGIWNYLLKVMTYSSLLVNSALFATTSKGFKNLLKVDSSYLLLVYLIAFEHCVLFLKILLNLIINEIPFWVRKALIKRNLKQNLYEQSRNENEFLTNNVINNLPGNLSFKLGKDLSKKLAHRLPNVEQQLLLQMQQGGQHLGKLTILIHIYSQHI